MFGVYTETVARAPTVGGSVAHSRVEFEKIYFLPVGCQAQITIKSLEPNDTDVHTTVYLWDPITRLGMPRFGPR